MIRAIFFDLDNTLIDRDAAFEACLAERFSDIHLRSELRALDSSGLGCRDGLFRAWSKNSSEEMNQEEFVIALLSHLNSDPQILAMLRALQSNYELGVISNGGSNSQRSKMKKTELDKVFASDHIWISGEVGVAKPDPRIFLLAAEKIGESPEHCLYVGDLDQVDGVGAEAAGFQYLNATTKSLRKGLMCEI